MKVLSYSFLTEHTSILEEANYPEYSNFTKTGAHIMILGGIPELPKLPNV